MMALEPIRDSKTSVKIVQETPESDSQSEFRTDRPDETAKTGNKPTDDLARILVISIAFSANCGGVSTLIGSPVNPIFKGQVDL